MSTVAAAIPGRLPPPSIFVIKPEFWASSYQDRPLVAMPVGLRMLSDEELDSCRIDADKAAEKVIDQGGDAFNAAHHKQLIRSAVARAICDTQDSSRAHEHFPCPDDQLEFALRQETIVAMFDQVERVQLENSPVNIPADDDDIADLMGKLADGALLDLEQINPLQARCVRRLLSFILTELSNAC